MGLVHATALILVAIAVVTEGNGNALDISAKGGEVWMVGTNHQIYRSVNGQFKLMGGCGRKIAAVPNGWNHWIIGCDKLAWRWNPDFPDGYDKWTKMPGGPLVHISAASKEKAVANSDGGYVWLWNEEQYDWSELSNCRALSVAYGLNDEIWMVDNRDLKLYRWNPDTRICEQQQGPAVTDGYHYIDIAQSGQMVVTGADGSVWVWDKNRNQWSQVRGKYCCIRATIDGTSVYCVTRWNNVWWNHSPLTVDTIVNCPKIRPPPMKR